METNHSKRTGQVKDPEPVFAFHTDSNHQGQVTACPVLPQFAIVRRPDDANLQQYKDIIIQQTVCGAWLDSLRLGVVRP